MRKLNKLAAAIAVALSAGVMAPQAHAVISAHYDQEGDALIFPLFYGVLENYYAIYNNSNLWVQGHIRFRGAAWSGELLDMDIILSPNDVFVFHLTDMDADGHWELDQSLDPNNFMYTGHSNTTCSANVPDNTGSATTLDECHDFSDVLFPTLATGSNTLDPTLYPNINDTIVADQKAYGYIEFIGEAVLVGCDAPPDEGCDLDIGEANDGHAGDNQDDWPINTWLWSDDDRGATRTDAHVPVAGTLDGVGNWLSGQFWIAVPGGMSTGMAGSALMFRNFRTDSGFGTHRIDDLTYPFDSEVILHTDNPAVDDAAYVYRFPDDDAYEEVISFNNTWGPTFADGDDYNVGANAVLTYTVLDASGAPSTTSGIKVVPPIMLGGASGNMLLQDAYQAGTLVGADLWDTLSAGTIYYRANSVAEVDLALNKNAQSFTGHFFDGMSSNKSATASPLMTAYFAHFPTKFYRAELVRLEDAPDLNNPPRGDYADLSHYINGMVDFLLSERAVKVYDVETWDTDENHECIPGVTSIVSPTVLDPGMTGVQGFEVENCQWPFRYELNLVTIQDLKATHDSTVVQNFMEGQLNVFPRDNNLTPTATDDVFRQSYPGLWYSFDLELATVQLRHWLPMFRSEWVED
jgi:hypothetical protein